MNIFLFFFFLHYNTIRLKICYEFVYKLLNKLYFSSANFLSLEFDAIIGYNDLAMETYRSGHNGPDSKSGKPLTGSVGSNPTVSAK